MERVKKKSNFFEADVIRPWPTTAVNGFVSCEAERCIGDRMRHVGGCAIFWPSAGYRYESVETDRGMYAARGCCKRQPGRRSHATVVGRSACLAGAVTGRWDD